jgi:hypothetical protein
VDQCGVLQIDKNDMLNVAPNKLVLFSVLVLHWVTHQDDDNLESVTRCGECNRSLGGPAPYSINHSAFPGHFDHDHPKSFGGQVITNCEASRNGGNNTKSIPLDGIITHTEFTRDVESMGRSSDTDPIDKRGGSTDHIRETAEEEEEA